MTTQTNNYYSVSDMAKALDCSQSLVRKLLKNKPFSIRKNPKNHKTQQFYHQDIVLPLCLKYKRDRSLPKGYITPAEAAARAGVHLNTIDSLLRRGTIKSTRKRNGRRAVELKSLDDYISRRAGSKMTKAFHLLCQMRYTFNQLRPALYGDPANPDVIAQESRSHLASLINLLTSKINELEETIA